MLDVDSSIRWNDVGVAGMTWFAMTWVCWMWILSPSPSLRWGDVPVLG